MSAAQFRSRVGEETRRDPCTKNRVLIVDDHTGVHQTFAKVLSLGIPSCRADLVMNGAEAVESFREVHQAVVIMDLRMPMMDGETAFLEIKKICEENKWRMPAVIFCTAYDSSERLKKIVANSRHHCVLHKPVTAEGLTEAVKLRLR